MKNNYRAMSTKRSMHSVKLKYRGALVLATACAIFAAILPTPAVDCAKVENAQLLQRLINDDDLLQMRAQKHAPAQTPTANVESGLAVAADADAEHERFHLYRSELKRLSYETIHRILRDENEPIYRREDAEMRYYRKRSYQSTHEVVRRSTKNDEGDDEDDDADADKYKNKSSTQQHFLNLARGNLSEFSASHDLLPAACDAIIEIDLSRNRLQRLNLTGCPQLHILDASQNQLTALPISDNDRALIALNLNGNRISAGTAPTNFHLRELHLSANQIENLGVLNLSLLDALETLDLSCNRIADLETTFFPQRMHNLKHLNLANNRLDAIFRETFYNLLSLNTLLLTRNNISDIDYETFLALPNLQYLDLSYNQLKGESIRALQGIPDLVGLSIAFNPEVGASMQEFVASWSLKELDASGTGLCQIPAALAQSVRTLKLTYNWLKLISCGDLDSYPLLQYLDLSHSRIEDIEDDALGRLEILEILFLDHNSLRKVPISLPTSLEHLFLQHNQIMDIQVQALQGLSNLQTLDLSGNKLLYLPALPLPKLLTLNLQSSGLKGLSQAIVHTLPQLRDLLLEDNPIKCSDLLGIAEWASPCRIAERSSSNVGSSGSSISSAAAAAAELGDGGNEEEQIVGQQPTAAEIDLKQKFVQMHNFFEKFKSNCGVYRQMTLNAALAAPPTCAIEMDDTEDEVEEVEDASEAPNKAAEVISLILPSEAAPTKNAKPKVYELNQNKNLKTKITETLPEAANNKAAVTAVVATNITLSNTSNSKNENNNNNHNNNTSNTASNWAETNNVRTTLETTKTLQDAAGATTSLVEQQITETTPETAATAPAETTLTTAGAAEAAAETTLTTTSQTATSTETEHANQDEPKRSQTTQQTMAKYAAVVAATTNIAAAMPTTTTAAVVVVKSQKLPQAIKTTIAAATTTTTRTQIPSSSSLNNSETFSYSKNVDGITPTTTATTTITNMEIATAKETNDKTMHVPQTISTAIKSDNNYVEATGLLNREGFKTSAVTAAAAVETATAATATDNMPTTITTDKDFVGRHDSNNDNNKVVDRRQQQNNFKRAQQSFNGISGQQNTVAGLKPTAIPTTTTTTTPTTEKTILASQTHSKNSLPSNASTPHQTTTAEAATTTKVTPTTTTTKMAPHKHEPLQLHIKDRHLIGTPLLMHKGQNILVEAAEQLMMLPATPSPIRAATFKMIAAASAATSTMRTLDAETNDRRTGKGSESGRLAKSQSGGSDETENQEDAGAKWLRDITGLTETDKNPKMEANNAKTNEQHSGIVAETEAEADGEQQHAKLATSHLKDKPKSPTTTTTTTTKEEIVANTRIRKLEEATHTTFKKLKKHDDNSGSKKKLLSLTMKKMTITKQSHPQKQQQQQQHHTLNTPRENEAFGGRDFDAKLFHELKPVVAMEHEFVQHDEEQETPQRSSAIHKHSTVNTPTGGGQQPPRYELNTFTQQQQDEIMLSVKQALHTHAAAAQSPTPEVLSKSEPLFDIRKATTTGHPALVILLSFSLFVVLLVGLMHVYRCELPWRRHAQQRPHQRQLNDDDAHSFLNYHSNNQTSTLTTTTMNLHPKWHHSARLQPPYSSPLHNLHVRELQKTSAIEEKSQRCKQFYNASLAASAPYFGSNVGGNAATNATVSNSDGSHTTSSLSSSSHSSAILDDEAFYIEMTPDSGQAARTLHSDLLPMELLSVAATTATTTTSRRTLDSDLEAGCNDPNSSAQDGVRRQTRAAAANQLNQAELGFEFMPVCSENVECEVRNSAPTTRKFGLW